MELTKLLRECEEQERELAWEGTFAQYLDMITRNPFLARSAHARIYDSITAQGVSPNRDGSPIFSLFAPDLFGLEVTLARVVDYFKSAAQGLEVRNRILLLLGPPASGKSTLVNLIKAALESYSRTQQGALYAIKGCPMQEEPLHLIPKTLRPGVEKEYSIRIEGELCPRCRYALSHQYQGRTSEVKVRRVIISEQGGVGVGSYMAGDPSSQELSRLVGSLDASLMGEDRLEDSGRAYRLDGELNVANRGIMEFVEIFKLDERFLTVLLTLAQERVIKTASFGSVSADEAVVSHSNLAQFQEFFSNKKTEALQDRIIVVKVPYNLRISEELKIYRKLLQRSGLQGVHIAPLTLPVTATFAVLSRLDPHASAGLTLREKAKMYDGQFLPGRDTKELEGMRETSEGEGLKGLSPRYVMNRLDQVVTQGHGPCALPMAALQALWSGVEEHIPLSSKEEQEHLLSLFNSARQEYDQLALLHLRLALKPTFHQEAEGLLDSYLSNVGCFLTGEGGEYDEEVMGKLEGAIHIPERDRPAFRRSVHLRFTGADSSDGLPKYQVDPRLEAALEYLLLPSEREAAQTLRGVGMPEYEKVALRNRITKEFQSTLGYCEVCALDLLEYLEHRSRDGEVLKVKGGKLRWLWKASNNALDRSII